MRGISVAILGSLIGLLLSAIGCLAEEPDLKVVLREGASVPLSDIGYYKVGYKLGGNREFWFPDGWTGHFENRYGISWSPFGSQGGKEAIIIHSPWRQGAGVTFVDYLLEWPKDRQLAFSFSSALKSEFVSQSDGVSYRVYVDGKRVLQHLETKGEWTPHKVDVSGNCSTPGLAKVRIEAHPGPKNNPAFDYSLMGDARFEVSGTYRETKAADVSSPSKLDNIEKYTNRRDRGTRPSSDLTGTNASSAMPGRFALSYRSGSPSDRIRSIDYVIEPSDGFLSGVSALVNGSETIPVFSGASLSSPTVLTGSELVGDSVRLTYRMGEIPIAVVLKAEGKTLCADVGSGPGPNQVSFGSIGPVPIRRQIRVPYLFETKIYALSDTSLFYAADVDWSVSNASSADGTNAYYQQKTDKGLNEVRERAYVTVSDRFEEVLPNIPHPASPYLKDLAGRIMLDFWGGAFADTANVLRGLRSYGVWSPAIIEHVWQRDGYDNGLPNHVSAAANLGGDEGMAELVRVAKSMESRFSLHENYIDMYPNSDYWNEDAIAVDSGGQKQKAWFNESTGVQSFAIKPTAILGYARKESPKAHELYGTNAAYLDVHTCVNPSFHVDFSAKEETAGTIEAVRRTNSELFAFERSTHDGPLFGEGRQHFYWAGLVDGVEAQVDGGDQEPVLADFDLLKIHPQMVNHGMGYMARWFSDDSLKNGGTVPPEEYDKYRATTLAYGHAGFIDSRTFGDLPQVVKEYYLMAKVQEAYGASLPQEISYERDGEMISVSEALQAGSLSNRVRVRYASGLTLWVNRSDSQWNLQREGADILLPPGGFYAEGPGVKAGTFIRGGRTVDYARWGDVIYADGRGEYYDSVADFGEIKTSKAIILRKDKDSIRLTTVPRYEPMEITIRLYDVLAKQKGSIKGVQVVSRYVDGKVFAKVKSRFVESTGELSFVYDGSWVNDLLITVK